MSTYWNSYPNFVHNATAPLQQEFKLLAEQQGWAKRGSRYKKEWVRCGLEEFTHHFGREENRLGGWQAMCILVGAKDVPESINQCKKILRRTWINIFDLIDAKRTGKPVRKHTTEDALRDYIIRTGKVFPKKTAKDNRFLKVLLIEVF
ncbi:hypothetical protein B0H13DRAFT_1599308 [Mycena leptocephala]|nr:hypothetical protein B0H13DRAFT_1599308 [Mycena leptocephala]